MQISLNTEYRTFTVYIIHAYISLQFKVYSPKHVINFLAASILPSPKNTSQNTQSNPQLNNLNRHQTISQATWLKSCFLKTD